MLDGKNFFKSTNKKSLKTYDNIQKTATNLGDDYKTVRLLNYPYFKGHHKLIKIDLRKQQAPDTDPKAIQQINFTVNIDRDENTHY